MVRLRRHHASTERHPFQHGSRQRGIRARSALARRWSAFHPRPHAAQARVAGSAVSALQSAQVAASGLLALLPGPQQPLRCQLALGRQGGLLGFVLDHPILDIRHKDAVALKPPSPDAADFSDAARVYTAIRAVTRLNNEFKEALPSRAEAAVDQRVEHELRHLRNGMEWNGMEWNGL